MPQRFAYRMKRLDEISPDRPVEELEQIKGLFMQSFKDIRSSNPEDLATFTETISAVR